MHSADKDRDIMNIISLPGFSGLSIAQSREYLGLYRPRAKSINNNVIDNMVTRYYDIICLYVSSNGLLVNGQRVLDYNRFY